MTLGTKTILFGVHQFFLHPFLVLIAWVKIYKSFPSWRELICIFIHDWGYWGRTNLKDADGDKHPELGAKIAHWLFDRVEWETMCGFATNGEQTTTRWPVRSTKWQDFILGHSSFYTIRNNITESKLFAPDKYWHCMIPLWFYKVLAIPSGEFRHYRELKHARMVAEEKVTDTEWWSKLQSVCRDKVNGEYKINIDHLSN